MITSDKYMPRVSFGIEEITQIIDRNISVPCPHCRQEVRIPESVVSSMSEKELRHMIEHLNDYIEQVRQASVEFFGEDMALMFLVEKMAKMKREFTIPNLTIVGSKQ